jgi:hypothetical protein
MQPILLTSITPLTALFTSCSFDADANGEDFDDSRRYPGYPSRFTLFGEAWSWFAAMRKTLLQLSMRHKYIDLKGNKTIVTDSSAYNL